MSTPGRTGALAGGFAIGVVICEDAAERLLAVRAQDLALRCDHHPCLGECLAGAADAETGNLDHAEIAGGLGAAGVVTAQGGDISLVLFGYLEQGLGRVNRQLNSIEGDGEHGVITRFQGAENAASGGASRGSDRAAACYTLTITKIIYNFI